jgi:hypothetical protein
LAELAGPAEGVLMVPAAVAWTGRRQYDLGIPGDAQVFYERVIVESLDAAELRRLLNADMLRSLWPSLFLPLRARQLWESRFPNLAVAA